METMVGVDGLHLAGAALAGAVLSVVFFGGLAWTVQRGLRSPRPARWFLISMLTRTTIVLAGFWFTAGTDWRKMLAALAGFAVARVIVTRLGARRLGANKPGADELAKENRHAP